MKTKLLGLAFVASAATIAQANPGNVQRTGGGFHGGAVARGAPAAHAPIRSGGVSSFHSTPARMYGSRPVYSGQRYSSFGMRSAPSSAYRRPYISSNRGSFTRSGPYTIASIPQRNRTAPFVNRNLTATNGWNQRTTGNQFRNRGNLPNTNRFQNGNNHLRGDWHNHVFAQRSGNWHRDWDHHSDHWWNGHRCCFINGSWVVFSVGFYPWWPSYYPDDYFYDGGFPYDGYGSSTYGYPYSYNYDPGSYDSGDYQGQMDYDQNSYPDQSQDYYDSTVYQTGAYYDPNGYTDQSQLIYSIVIAAQERLAQEGYYRGETDGALNPEMQKAVRHYQITNGLQPTGNLDRDTVATMGLR